MNFEFTNDITTKIETLLLGCNDSILSVDFLNDYKIDVVDINSFAYKDKITDGSGHILFDYDSRVNPINDGKYFRLYKERKDKNNIVFQPHKTYSIPNEELKNTMETIKVDEDRYIYRIINLLRVFKSGNIGVKHIFIKQQAFFGVNYNLTNTIQNENRNAINTKPFVLSSNEIVECNNFIKDYYEEVYDLMTQIIDQFSFAMDQIGIEMCFEKHISVLETVLLKKSEQGKKEALSKRVAVLLGTTDAEICGIYGIMKDFYKYRSESTHEGKTNNINDTNLQELEDITRKVIKKYFSTCKMELIRNPSILWEDIKRAEIIKLKGVVLSKQSIF